MFTNWLQLHYKHFHSLSFENSREPAGPWSLAPASYRMRQADEGFSLSRPTRSRLNRAGL